MTAPLQPGLQLVHTPTDGPSQPFNERMKLRLLSEA